MKDVVPLTLAQQELVGKVTRLAAWLAVRFYKMNPWVLRAMSEEDVVSEAYLAICHASRSWDADLGTFKAYASKSVRNWLSRLITTLMYDKRKVALVSKSFSDFSTPGLAVFDVRGRGQTPAAEAADYDDLESRLRFLPSRSRDVLVMRHVHGLTLTEAVPAVGVNRSRINVIEQQALERCRGV